nr:immunoglobulin heavy chain junction region [Macaca mulatta]
CARQSGSATESTQPLDVW